MRLTSVDFPTFGRPTTVSTGSGAASLSSTSSSVSSWAWTESSASSGDTGPLFHYPEDQLDDLIERVRRRVKLVRVGGSSQRRDRSRRIEPVASAYLGMGQVDGGDGVVPELGGPPVCTGRGCGSKEDLDRGRWRDHRADVTALDDYAARPDDRTLEIDEMPPNSRDRAHGAHRVRDPPLPNRPCHIDPIHGDPGRLWICLEREYWLVGVHADRRRVFDVGTML